MGFRQLNRFTHFHLILNKIKTRWAFFQSESNPSLFRHFFLQIWINFLFDIFVLSLALELLLLYKRLVLFCSSLRICLSLFFSLVLRCSQNIEQSGNLEQWFVKWNHGWDFTFLSFSSLMTGTLEALFTPAICFCWFFIFVLKGRSFFSSLGNTNLLNTRFFRWTGL